MTRDKEFAVLVGKACLFEMNAGNRDSAIAFGRAFLLALGMKGPEPEDGKAIAKGKQYGENLALAEN